MSWSEQQQAWDNLLRTFGVDPLPLGEQRQEHVRELRRDRQARRRGRLRTERQRQKSQAQLWRAIERIKAKLPPTPQRMKISVQESPPGRSRRRFRELDRVWRITFDGRSFWVNQFRAKQLGGRARDELGRFTNAKMQPVPGHRVGCSYAIKGWHIRACLMSVVQKHGASHIAQVCRRNRTTVWRCLNRSDIRALADALRRSEPWIIGGGEFQIEIPVRRNQET